MLEALRMSHAELSVVLVADGQIRGLNRTYRGLDRPTDVLSFPMHGRRRPLRGAHLLGDVVISTDMVRRQASAEGVALIAVAERLLIHGLLHLIGYDHEISEAEARRMERRERMLAASIRPAGQARWSP
jgi:rRNA maturation RNase YbeY